MTDSNSGESWISRLTARLRQPLPGHAAQRRFEPELAFGRHAGPAPASARSAAVTLLMYPRDGAWHVPLTLRPAELPHHAGQVSLPGGNLLPGEESAVAALRELEEELGVSPNDVTILGRLTDLYLFTTDFLIVPWIGAARQRPEFRPNPREVAELLEVPLTVLVDPAARQVRRQQRKGVAFGSPGIVWQEHFIWGATSMILAELAEVCTPYSSRSG